MLSKQDAHFLRQVTVNRPRGEFAAICSKKKYDNKKDSLRPHRFVMAKRSKRYKSDNCYIKRESVVAGDQQQ